MDKNFNDWNTLKKELDVSNNKLFFDEGEIWWCSVGVNIGVEMNGKNGMYERPVLIIKKINLQSAIIAPLTNTFRNNLFIYQLKTIQSSVTISQIKTVSNKRFLRKECRISINEFAQIIIRIKYLFTSYNETTTL
jgi:mRNA-degrading endonuclease toxin of MazEF toxin-antitoxin module